MQKPCPVVGFEGPIWRSKNISPKDCYILVSSGLPDAAVRGAREQVRPAIKNVDVSSRCGVSSARPCSVSVERDSYRLANLQSVWRANAVVADDNVHLHSVFLGYLTEGVPRPDRIVRNGLRPGSDTGRRGWGRRCRRWDPNLLANLDIVGRANTVVASEDIGTHSVSLRYLGKRIPLLDGVFGGGGRSGCRSRSRDGCRRCRRLCWRRNRIGCCRRPSW